MRVLVACEFSGIVRDAFKARGHDVMSCDLLPTEKPGPHYQGNVFDIIDANWDMMIAFPPCTHLAVSGAQHFEEKIKDGRQAFGMSFFMKLAKSDIYRIAIENPVGIMSKFWRKPDQIIQPYYFGDEAQKTTCLWLKGLKPLTHSKDNDLFYKKTHVNPGEFVYWKDAKTGKRKRMPKWYSDNKKSSVRSRTFTGIAQAMADQWG